jgi:signal transduction histidine kinase
VAERLTITFEDTGTGIAPEHLPKVFEPYFTTKEVGIGLGLALTKKIIEEHGGWIALSSRPGAGTVVRLALPIGPPRA